MRGKGGVASEGKLVGVPKFYSWACHNEYPVRLELVLKYDCGGGGE